MFSSTIQVLKVDAPETRKFDGQEFTVYTAQCALLDDDGVLDKVGRLKIPENMREVVKVGTFRAAFALEVAQWGKTKGDIMATLTGLQPLTAKHPAPTPPAAPANPLKA